jgi:hypothetical protein
LENPHEESLKTKTLFNGSMGIFEKIDLVSWCAMDPQLS